MNFQTIRYLGWAKRTHDVATVTYDLSTSAVAAVPADLLGPLEGLAIAGNNAFGHERLRAAIAARHGVPGAQVLCSLPGTSAANFLVAAALCRPGDGALVEWPCYEPLWRVYEAQGARVEYLERRPEDRYALDLGRVETAFVRGARFLVLSNPMNPTGVLLPPEVIREAGALAARYGGHAIVDEIYLDGAFRNPAARTAAGAPGVIVTSSLTKAYGLGALRAGWAIAPEAIVARCYEIFDYLAVEQPFIADELALRAFERLPALRARSEAIQGENLPVVRRWAAARRDVTYLEPDGGFIAWLGLPGGWTSRSIEGVLRARDTAVAPGHFFGAPGHVRIGFGGSTAKLTEGLKRLGEALDGPAPSATA